MVKTAKQIQSDVIALLRGSILADNISGRIYRDGYRPRNSAQEDCVVIFTAGITGEIQTGIVTLNIFIPDIDSGSGAWVEDGHRAAEIEDIANQWCAALTADKSDYLFSLNSTIRTLKDHEIAQHFVVVQLKYKLLDTNNNN
ncbi:MAG: hypothetical protein LBG17_04705 [Bacteroidales bacterium]|jgi:hypothetical protein|nr:hypothetical protein [Bacteroidales bacterium]